LLAGTATYLDQVTKRLVFTNLEIGETVPVIKYVFHITLVLNKGIAFGMLTRHLNVIFLIAFSSTLLMISLFLHFFHSARMLVKVGLSLVLGGAFGNLIDRIQHGVIIDFIDFRIWPVFNIADCAICVGAFCVVLGMITKYERKKP
jgi:signal peptidase II